MANSEKDGENHMDWGKLFTLRVDVVGSVIVVVTTILTLALLVRYQTCGALGWLAIIIWALWAVGPPVFFLAEWTAFQGDLGGRKFESMKYSHELASKFWIGGVGVISAILFAVYDDKLVCFSADRVQACEAHLAAAK